MTTEENTRSRAMYRGARNLGRSQRLVLHLLAGDAKSAEHLAYDWPTLTESAARGALARLGDRGLVDVAGWDGVRLTYKLTERGAAIEAILVRDNDD